MKIIFISELFYPITGGVTTYVLNVIEEFKKTNNDVSLIIPDFTNSLGNIETEVDENIKYIRIGLGKFDIKTEYKRNLKYQFSNQVNLYLYNIIGLEYFDVVHILFGHFVAEKLDVQFLNLKKIKTVFTIHNLPPQECGQSWSQDRFDYYCKDVIRKRLVKLINLQRLKKNNFDIYIVPSMDVKNRVKRYSNINSFVVYNGPSDFDFKQNEIIKLNDDIKIKILTTGGIIPHKNQIEAIEIAKKLKLKGINFEWKIVGPIRNERYYKELIRQVKVANVEGIEVLAFVDKNQLQELYKTSDLYVHLSFEEGFCISALDAAKFGLRVVGLEVGAIKEIISSSQGVLVKKNDTKSFVDAIEMVISQLGNKFEINDLGEFSWKNLVISFLKLYANKSLI